MGKNNSSYRLFQEMLSWKKDNVSSMICDRARWLMELNPDNPFKVGSQESDLFDTMSVYYAKWKNGTVEAKYNMRMFNETAVKLCKLVEDNPFTFDEKEEQEEIEAKRQYEEQQKQIEEEKQKEEQRKLEEQKIQEEQIAEEHKITLEENEHVLGVVPEEEKDKKSWLKFLFPWKKEGEQNDSK